MRSKNGSLVSGKKKTFDDTIWTYLREGHFTPWSPPAVFTEAGDDCAVHPIDTVPPIGTGRPTQSPFLLHAGIHLLLAVQSTPSDVAVDAFSKVPVHTDCIACAVVETDVLFTWVEAHLTPLASKLGGKMSSLNERRRTFKGDRIALPKYRS